MWLTPGRASGGEKYAPILFINTPEEGECYGKEVQRHRKMDYKPLIYLPDEAWPGSIQVATSRG